MFFGSIFIFLFLFFTNQISGIWILNLRQVSWIILTSIILLGYVLTWYSGLKYIPVSEATVILLLGSPITTFLSFIYTHQLTLHQIIGSLLILLGIILILGFRKIFDSLKKIPILFHVRT